MWFNSIWWGNASYTLSASECATEVWSYFLHKEWTTYTTVVIFHTSFFFVENTVCFLVAKHRPIKNDVYLDHLSYSTPTRVSQRGNILNCISSEVAWLFRCGYDATEYDEMKPTEGIYLQGEPSSMKFSESGWSLYYTNVARYSRYI
jgi:hypothetical protein